MTHDDIESRSVEDYQAAESRIADSQSQAVM